MKSFFYRVPAGANAFIVTLEVQKRGVQLAMMRPDTRTASPQHVVATGGRGGGGGGGAPANLPKEMVTKLNAEIRKIVERPEIKAQLAERGMEAFSSTPEEFDAFLKQQLVLWEKLITDAGIEKQ